MNIIKQIIVMIFMLVLPAYAIADEEVKDSGYYAEVQLFTKSGDVFGQSFYVQKSTSEKMSIYAYAYHENGFREVFVGTARQMGNFQVGVGVGAAQYDGANHTAINLWLDYESGPYAGALEYEHYSRETEDPVFLRGHFQKNIRDYLAVGVYSETGFGVGPMVVFNLRDESRLRISRSLTGRQEDGASWILEFTMAFE